MIKTSFDPLQILYTRLSGSDLDIEMSGQVYKMARPNGSKLEDLVINGLPITTDQFQLSTANVNLYVPDLQVSLSGAVQYTPDTARMAHLTSVATELLYEYYGPSFRFNLVSQQVIEEPETNQHYINLRIDFEFFPDS